MPDGTARYCYVIRFDGNEHDTMNATSKSDRPSSGYGRIAAFFAGTERRKLYSLLALTGTLALATRAYYSLVVFHDALYTADAAGVMLRGFYVARGMFNPRLLSLWRSQIPIDLTYGFFIKVLPFDPMTSARIASCLITTATLLILVYIVYRYIDRAVALFFGMLLAINPYFSFTSTEPEKAPLVLLFFSLSLLFLYTYRYDEEHRKRSFLLFLLFLCLMLFSYQTAVLFAVCLIVIYLLFSWDFKYHRNIVNVLKDAYLYVLAGSAVLFAVIVPRIVEAVTSSTRIYPAVEAAGDPAGTAGGFLDPITDFFSLFIHRENLAAGRFLEAILTKAGTVVLILGVLALVILVFSRNQKRIRWNSLPFVVWAIVVTGLFSLRYYCHSHNSRYPYYVMPAFLFLAAYFLAWFLKKLYSEKTLKYVALLVVLLLIVVSSQTRLFARHNYEVMRNRYYTNKLVADDLLDVIKVRDDEGIIIRKWPSLVYYLLEKNPELEERLYPVGWGNVNLQVFTRDFIEEHNIRYFVHDEIGDDYYNTPDVLLDQLKNLEDIYVFSVAEIEYDEFRATVYYLDY